MPAGSVANDVLATILHISDLHFSRKIDTDKSKLKTYLASISLPGGLDAKDLYGHGFSAAFALSNLFKKIQTNRRKEKIPLGVVVSGDLTRSGEDYEFNTGVTYLRGTHNLKVKKLGFDLGPDKYQIDANSRPGLFCIPGNHDVWGQNRLIPSNEFQNHFSYTYPKTWKIKTHSQSIYIHGLDSTQTTRKDLILAKGYVHQTQIDELKDNIKIIKSREPESINIVSLHHPLIDTGKKRTMNLEDFDVIAQSLNGYAEMVLSGHIHKECHICKSPKIPHHAIAGTATQICSKKNCMLIDIFPDKIILNKFFLNDSSDRFKKIGAPITFEI